MGKKTKTQKKLTAWKTVDWSMRLSKYVVAETPATVMVAVKHSEWFTDVTQTACVSTGFAMFVSTVLATVLCIAKKEETFKKVSPFVTAAIYLIVAGMICLFMAKILLDLGWLLVFTGGGMVAAVTEDTVEKRAVKKKVEYWSGVLSDAGLNEKENRKKAKRQSDVMRAKQEARSYQPIE